MVPHIQRLIDGGLTAQQVAREAGVDPSAVRWALSGRKKLMLRGTADKILGVPVGARTTVGFVSSVGAVRRIQALYTLGHFNRRIAEASGLSRCFIIDLANEKRASLTIQRDAGVRRAYDELSMTVGGSSKARLYAEAHGWVPPLAWDDDMIDDPSAVPSLDAVPCLGGAPEEEVTENAVARFLMGESVVLDHAARREVVAYLMEWTALTPVEIAARVESSANAVSRTWERVKRQARDEGRQAPWRRHFEPMTRAQLSRRELEVAA
ncbi:hypothetical protein [Streptomyces sp. NPDC048611]|uniref:hypothetical protein n=1 Tax=Streptomyces sp. NPDC048611 TaxID=3155635 RepID=UPI003431476B